MRKLLLSLLTMIGFASVARAQSDDVRQWVASLKPSVNPQLADLSDNTWRKLATAGDSFNHPKTEVGLVYDEKLGGVIYFAGCSQGYTNSVWLYHVGSNTWREVLPWTTKKEELADCPIGQCGYYAAYNSDLGLFFKHRGVSSSGLGRGGSGRDSNSWTFDARTLKWDKVATGPHFGASATWPAVHCCYGLVYDRDAKAAILYGGLGEGETWAFDFSTKTWRNLKPATSPPPLSMPNMVYDSRNKVTLLFGGQTGGYEAGHNCNDTWAYHFDTNRWVNLEPKNPPSPRLQSQVCYDSNNGVMILFGGHANAYPKRDSGEFFTDTWVYNYAANVWTSMSPAEHPGRSDVRFMAFDPVNNIAINIASNIASNPKKQTWVYRYKRTSPPP